MSTLWIPFQDLQNCCNSGERVALIAARIGAWGRPRGLYSVPSAVVALHRNYDVDALGVDLSFDASYWTGRGDKAARKPARKVATPSASLWDSLHIYLLEAARKAARKLVP